MLPQCLFYLLAALVVKVKLWTLIENICAASLIVDGKAMYKKKKMFQQHWDNCLRPFMLSSQKILLGLRPFSHWSA